MNKLTVDVKASEGGNGKVFEGLGKEIVFEVKVVGVCVDRAHECLIGTCLHVRGNTSDVEGLAELMCVIAITLKRGMSGGICRVTDRIDAWKDWEKDGINIGLLICGVAQIVVAVEHQKYASLSG